jgi:hypothetical protein
MESEESVAQDVEDGGRCLCGRDSTEGSAEDEALALQVGPLEAGGIYTKQH